MSIPIQLIRTSELDKRFNIGKNTRVNRLAMLGLTPDRLTKQGRYYLLSQEQLDLFIDFDKYILETGSPDGYPKLLSAHSDHPITSDLPAEKHNRNQGLKTDKVVQIRNQVDNQVNGRVDSDSEQLAITKQDLEDLLNLIPEQPEASSFTGEFTGTQTYHDEGLIHRVKTNAQSRALSILLAEHTLAEQYINNPDLLDPELRSQLDEVEAVKICPKKLAASLVSAATVRHLMTAA